MAFPVTFDLERPPAYLASLVDRYPPFALETGPLSPARPAS